MAECYTYTYDSWCKPLTVTHALSNRCTIQTGEYTYAVTRKLHDYEYDFAGRLVLDKRNDSTALKTQYAYNIRSAVTGIGSGWDSTYQSYGSSFLENLSYGWGGNINAMDWMCGSDGVTRTYNYSYDGLSRLTGASYTDNLSGNGTYNRAYTYDLHGNILSLITPSGTVTATYNGNQRSGNFTYDANGNMTADPEAGLTGMTYNNLNLLSGYTQTNSNSQYSFYYSASGEKVSEQERNSDVIENDKKFFGNLVYDNSLVYPTRLLIDGGYVDITTNPTGNSSTYAYRYYVQDHLGNNRLVTDDSGTILQTNHYDPYGQLLSDISSSIAVSQYKYGNKEWDATTASYDFGARRYTPAIPRWTTIDPLAEKYYAISPYVYCAGNPVNLVDLEGKRVIPKGDKELNMIQHTLPKDARDYVVLNSEGEIDLSVMQQYAGVSENFASLMTMVNSKEYCVYVELNDSFSFKRKDGSIGLAQMSYLPCEYEDDKDVAFSFVTGLTTGEGGFMGKTLFPDLEGVQNSVSPNIEVIINKNLSELGASETFSHEGYGHALLYILTNGNHNAASHSFDGSVDQNLHLKQMIFRARKETVNNY